MDAHASDGGGQDHVHPPVLENETPGFVTQNYTSVVLFLQQYGWFLLLAVALLYYLKTKFSPRFDAMRRNREEQEYLNVDADVARDRLEAMDRARRRLQEQHDAQAARYAEEMKKKEEEKRQAKLEDWERHQKGLGYRSKYRPQDQGSIGASGSADKPKPKKNVYRNPDYMPLGGGSSSSDSCSWRPARKGGAGGG